jgi:hypothetical protein
VFLTDYFPSNLPFVETPYEAALDCFQSGGAGLAEISTVNEMSLLRTYIMPVSNEAWWMATSRMQVLTEVYYKN